MSDEQKQLSKARQALVDRVLSRLDAGEMPWDNGMQGISEKPYNAITGKPYRGMNVLNLMLSFKQDPRWLTFNQAKDKGYTVKKGAKGVPIELYKTIDRRTKKDADLDAIREETKDMTFEERQEFKRKNLQSFAQSYYVFNASDIHGIEPYVPKELTPVDITARNERIERVIADSEARIYYDGNGRNYYSPASDEIHLTERVAFKSDEFFYNTALHEMAHSTGHSSRLNRPGGTRGSKEYAREELVAEIASVLAATELGLNHSDRVIENSAEYIRSWAKNIRDNPQTLIDAAFDASRATDFVCGMERQQERPQEKAQKEKTQSSISQLYNRYAALQGKYTDAVVVQRIGDFYEVIGEKARATVDELGLTLTSRDVGLSDRVPMYGFPYHVMEQYTAKLLEKHSVVIAENDGDEKYMPSHADTQKTPLEISAQKESGKRETQTVQLRLTEAEGALFNDFLDGWNDKASELHEIIDFGADRPTSEEFWKGLEMLGDVDRSDTSFSVKFDRSRARSFTISNKTVNIDTVDAPTEQHKKPLMINFYAGPSSGKTTAALELTAALKKAGYNAEYVSEFAKDLVLEGRTDELKNQQFVTDGQYQRFDRIRNSADIIVTDSPVLLGLVYGKYNGISEEYAKQIRGYYDNFDNFNMFITRPQGAGFQQEGRVHDESQSIQLDGEIKAMLDAQGVFYGSYKRDDIAKTVERIDTTFNRLYGEHKEKTQKESAVTSKASPSSSSAHILKTNLDNIPDAMKALPNWVAFRTKTLEDGKVKKILLSPNKGASSVEYLKWAKSDDPTTWATFAKAAEFAKKYRLDGIAFSMSNSGMTCIDLDHHLDENGKPSELAQKFIDAAQGTYIEKSVSGRGLHIFYAGERPDGYQNRNIGLDLETYDNTRFMSMTGNLYDGAEKEIMQPSSKLTDLLKSNLGKMQRYVAPSAPLGFDDNALIDKIRNSRVGRDFDALWNGQIITYNMKGEPDHSTSDYKLCNILGFFSGGDVAQVERLIKSSGLYRPDKPDKYYALTARNACDALAKVYTPREKNNTKKNNSKPSGSGRGGNNGR